MISRRQALRLGALTAVGGGIVGELSARGETVGWDAVTDELEPSWTAVGEAGWTERWRRQVDGSPATVEVDSSGTCWLAGESSQGEQGWVASVDTAGEQTTGRRISAGDREGSLRTLLPTSSAPILAGVTRAESRRSRAWAVAMNTDQTVRWRRQYQPSPHSYVIEAIESDRDGSGYLVAGRRESFQSWLDSAWLANLSPDGTLRWSRTYDAAISSVDDLVVGRDGQVFLVGGLDRTEGVGTDAGIIALRTGGTAWRRTYPAWWFTDAITAGTGANSEGLVTVGLTDPDAGPRAGVMTYLDEQGHPYWWHELRVDGYDASLSAVHPVEGGYVSLGELEPDEEEEDTTDISFLLTVDAEGERSVGYRFSHAVIDVAFGADGGLFVLGERDGRSFLRSLGPPWREDEEQASAERRGELDTNRRGDTSPRFA
ncbi:hypothetical protein [Haloarchaeobius amylolyticus]|uniref:hypothetical protein n=1 Tax=Haloarchaeobius amylolyticus TaxID=1198296 RepID=UPI00226F030B|nr:hypothetical protein [Haloarchaeobius amylolyticus]